MSDNTINRSDIEQSLRDQLGLTKDQAKKAIIAIEAVILNGLSKGKTVNWIEFLKLEPVYKGSRPARNPKTGEEIQIPAQWRVKAHVAPALDKVVKDLPKPN